MNAYFMKSLMKSSQIYWKNIPTFNKKYTMIYAKDGPPMGPQRMKNRHLLQKSI